MEIIKKYHEQLVLGVALLLFPLFLFNAPGTHDVWMWIGWATPMTELGLIDGYSQSNSFYPPLFFAGMRLLMFAEQVTGIPGFYLFKSSLLICSIATCWLVWRWTQNQIIVLMLYFSLVFSSVYMVYVDAWIAPFLTGALFVLSKKRYRTFSILYCITCLIKWQPIILSPVIGLYILGVGIENHFDRQAWRQLLLRCVGPGLLLAGAVLSIFGFDVIFQKLAAALNEGILSAQALNLGWVMTYSLHIFSPDLYGPLQNNENDMINGLPLLAAIPLKILFIAVLLTTLFYFFKNKKSEQNFLLFLLTVYLSYYALNTGVHENHLFIATLLSLTLAGLNEKYLPTAIIINLMNMINMLMFYPFYEDYTKAGLMVFNLNISLVFSVFNTLFFFYFWMLALKKTDE